MHPVLHSVNQAQLRHDLPDFGSGDVIGVISLIREGGKLRKQRFEGLVIKRQGSGVNAAVLVRKHSKSVYIERLFRIHSPLVKTIEVVKYGKVRRARIYYMRQRQGKVARIKQVFKHKTKAKSPSES